MEPPENIKTVWDYTLCNWVNVWVNVYEPLSDDRNCLKLNPIYFDSGQFKVFHDQFVVNSNQKILKLHTSMVFAVYHIPYIRQNITFQTQLSPENVHQEFGSSPYV